MIEATAPHSRRDSALAVRIFTIGAIALVVGFAVFSILRTIRASSPLARVTERLVQSGKFEPLGFDWQPSWALAALEEAPWAGQTTGVPALSSIDPTDDLLVINLWATWCEPCRTELPDMFKLSSELRDQPVTFMFIGYEEGWDAPRALFRDMIGTMPRGVVIARDPAGEPGGEQAPETFWARLGATGIPETFFVRDGVVVGKIVGAINWNHPDIREYVRLLASGGRRG